VRAAEDGNRRTAREEAVTAGVGAAKANGRRVSRRGTAAGAADDTAAACLVSLPSSSSASRPI